MKFKVGDRVLERYDLEAPPGTIVKINLAVFIVKWDEIPNNAVDSHRENELVLLFDPNDILKEML